MTLVQVRQDDYQRVCDEILLLRRKFKYIQGVSTVFRQKIALIVRECANNPGLQSPRLRTMYAKALTELGVLDEELDSGLLEREGRPLPPGQELPSSPQTRDTPSYSELARILGQLGGAAGKSAAWLQDQSRDDINKAYHLCTLLQERNAANERASAAEAAAQPLKEELQVLKGRYDRLATLMAEGLTTAGDAAQKELYEQKIAQLQDELIAAKSELAGLRSLLDSTKARGGDNNDTLGSELMSPDLCSGTIGGLKKQNEVLRRRVVSLRDDIETLKGRAGGGMELLQSGVSAMASRVRSLQQEIANRDKAMLEAEARAADAQKELEDVRSSVRHYVQQLDTLSAENRSLAEAFEALKAQSKAEQLQLGAAVEDCAGVLAKRDQLVSSLQTRLLEATKAMREQEIRADTLSTQLKMTRAQLHESIMQQEQRQDYAQSLKDSKSTIERALADARRLHLGGAVGDQLAALQARLSQLEGVEAQVRLKDDKLALLEDERDRAVATAEELRTAMSSLSALFGSLPASAQDVELLVIELEESRRELRQCHTQRTIPDMTRLEARIDMRALEAAHSRRDALSMAGGRGLPMLRPGAQRKGRDEYSAPGGHANGDASHSLAMPNASSILADEDAEEEAAIARRSDALLDIPPPPELIDITGSVAGRGTAPAEPAAQVAHQLPTQGEAGPRRDNLVKDAEVAFNLFAVADAEGMRTVSKEDARLAVAGLRLKLPQGIVLQPNYSFPDFITLCMSLPAV